MLAADHARAFTAALTPDDIAAITRVITVFRDMCKRRAAAAKVKGSKVAKVAAAAAAASAGATVAAVSVATDVRAGKQMPVAATAATAATTETDADDHNEGALGGDDDGQGHEKAPWRLDQEIELLSKVRPRR